MYIYICHWNGKEQPLWGTHHVLNTIYANMKIKLNELKMEHASHSLNGEISNVSVLSCVTFSYI